MTISEAKKRVKQCVNSYDQICSLVIEDMEIDIVNANREQLMQGKTADGEEITPAYTQFTIMIKRTKGQPTDKVTLFDTGNFQERMFSELQGKEVIIDSNDEKRDKLIMKYGERIFGIDNDHSEELKKVSIAKIIRIIKEITQF